MAQRGLIKKTKKNPDLDSANRIQYFLTGSDSDLLQAFLGEYEAGADEYARAHRQTETDVEITT